MIYIRITRGRDCSLLVCLFHFSCNRFSTYYFYRAHIDVRSLMKKNGAPFVFPVCMYASCGAWREIPVCMYARNTSARDTSSPSCTGKALVGVLVSGGTQLQDSSVLRLEIRPGKTSACRHRKKKKKKFLEIVLHGQ